MSNMTAALMQNTKSKNTLVDPFWHGFARHGLRKVKDKSSFASLINEVAKCETDVSENQQFLVHEYMINRGYSSNDIDHYLLNGLLVRIVRDIYTCYTRLL